MPPAIPQTLPAFRQEPRLAHAGLAHDPDHLPLALGDPRPQRPQRRQLELPPDKATARPHPIRQQGMAAGGESEYLVGADRVGLARERLWRTRHQTHLVMHQLGGGSTDQEGPGAACWASLVAWRVVSPTAV